MHELNIQKHVEKESLSLCLNAPSHRALTHSHTSLWDSVSLSESWWFKLCVTAGLPKLGRELTSRVAPLLLSNSVGTWCWWCLLKESTTPITQVCTIITWSLIISSWIILYIFCSSTHISRGKVTVTAIKPSQILWRLSKNKSGDRQIRVFLDSGNYVHQIQVCSQIIDILINQH